MKVSIITVAYQSAATLADTLKSVAAQTHGDVEHIVIDGGSTDATPDVVRAHGGHVAAFVSEPDRGIYDAMNKGVQRATGDIVAFLNADDHYAHERVLADVARAFGAARLEAVFGDVGFYRPERPDRLVRRYRARRFAPQRIAWGWMPPHPALFVQRELFGQVGPFRTDYRIAGDFEWVARAFGRPGVRYRHLPQVMVHMRTGGVSTGGWRSTLLLNREVMRACHENGIATSWPKLLSKYPAKMLEFVLP